MPEPRIKLLFVDCETTGLDAKRHAIIEIAFIIEIDGVIISRDIFRIQPFENDVIDMEALHKNATSLETIKTYPDPRFVHHLLTKVLSSHVDKFNSKDKFFFLAYNATFDADFLRNFFLKCGDKYYGSFFFTPAIDIMSLAGKYLLKQRHTMPNFQQGTVAKTLGINVTEEKLHGASYDVHIARKIYYAVTDGGLV